MCSIAFNSRPDGSYLASECIKHLERKEGKLIAICADKLCMSISVGGRMESSSALGQRLGLAEKSRAALEKQSIFVDI